MRDTFELSNSRVYQAYAAGQLEAGLKMAEALLARNRVRFGEKHANTVIARGILAIGFSRSGNDDLAKREFKEVIPQLLTDLRVDEAADTDVAAADRRRAREAIAEAYFTTVARTQPGQSEIGATFELADLVRSQSVHRAPAASSARLLARDARLAEQVRKEQDLAKQIGAQTSLLGSVLALPNTERDEQVTRALGAQIASLRAEHGTLRKSLQQSFPGYADLIDAKPPSLADIRKVLRPHEVLLSFYLGRRNSFLWAVRKDGDVSLTTPDITNTGLEDLVRRLRASLETHAEALDRLPPFDGPHLEHRAEHRSTSLEAPTPGSRSLLEIAEEMAEAGHKNANGQPYKPHARNQQYGQARPSGALRTQVLPTLNAHAVVYQLRCSELGSEHHAVWC